MQANEIYVALIKYDDTYQTILAVDADQVQSNGFKRAVADLMDGSDDRLADIQTVLTEAMDNLELSEDSMIEFVIPEDQTFETREQFDWWANTRGFLTSEEFYDYIDNEYFTDNTFDTDMTTEDLEGLADWSDDSFGTNPGDFKDFGDFDKWDDEMDF